MYVKHLAQCLAHSKPQQGLGYTKKVWSKAGSPSGVVKWREQEVRGSLHEGAIVGKEGGQGGEDRARRRACLQIR